MLDLTTQRFTYKHVGPLGCLVQKRSQLAAALGASIGEVLTGVDSHPRDHGRHFRPRDRLRLADHCAGRDFLQLNLREHSAKNAGRLKTQTDKSTHFYIARVVGETMYTHTRYMKELAEGGS